MGKKTNTKSASKITLRNGDITSNEFNTAFSRLLSVRNIPAFIRLKLVKIAKALQAEQEIIQDIRLETLRKYVETDEKGNPKVQEDNVNFVWKSDEDKTTFSKEWDDVLDGTIDVDMPDLKIEELNKVDLSPAELLQLSPILSD